MTTDNILNALLDGTTYTTQHHGFTLGGHCIDYAVDRWPVGSRHFSFQTYSRDLGRCGACREIDISVWKWQLLLSITHSPTIKENQHVI